MEILEYIIVPIISLVVLFLLTKLMGYRQVSQLNMYDYINGITIGSIASEFVMAGFDDFLRPLLAMIVYAIVIVGLSKAADSSLKLRQIIDGQAVVLYENNCLYNEELKKAKLDLDEFLMQCRIAGYFELDELQTVVLETNGNFSFFPKEKYRPTRVDDLNITINKVDLPTLLIKEGVIFYDNLKQINQNEKWLRGELDVKGILVDEVLLMYRKDNSNIVVYTTNQLKKDFM